MTEEKLYPMMKDYLEEQGYYPVKVEPSIRIKNYRPDVTGLKGKEVQCVEVKLDFNEKSVMEAVTQARVYMFGATHVFVAFPIPYTDKERELLDLLKKLCEENGIGIYLIDKMRGKVQKIMDARFSQYFSLPDYDATFQQLGGEELIILDNTYPEYIRDVCVYLNKNIRGNSIIKKDLVKQLEKEFKPEYWLWDSRSKGKKGGRGERSTKIKNRIEKTIDGSIQLGFFDFSKDKNELKLNYNGQMLARLADSIDYNEPKKLNEKTRIFFRAYLLCFPVYKKSIEILRERKDFMLLSWVVCRKCDFKYSDINNDLLCPKCKKSVEISLLHKLRSEYGIDGYYPIIFTKGVHGESLDVFEFGTKDKVDAIKLKL